MTTWQTLTSMAHLIAIAMWLGAIVFFLAVSGPAVNELAPKLSLKNDESGQNWPRSLTGSRSGCCC